MFAANREVWNDPENVLAHFSLESLRNARKYFGKDDKDRYAAGLKTARKAARDEEGKRRQGT